MPVYIVVCDLNAQRPDVDSARLRLADHLSRYDHIRDQGLPSVWFIHAKSDAEEICNGARPLLTPADRFIVTQMNLGHDYAYVDKDVWEWITSRV